MKFKKSRVIYLLLVCALTFIFVFTPHFDNRFPIHIDEWHHISEAIRFSEGSFGSSIFGVEIGFHFFLSLILRLFDLVEIYKFLPALWAVISGLTIFYVVRKKTGSSRDGFFISVMSMIFFASIKSNTNLTGLWFFTPLSFVIPLIFLYIYFFTKGFEEGKKKYVLISLGIMLILIPTHSISFLFAIPFLLIYSYFYRDFVFKNYKFFLMFLIVPLLGVVFYSYIRDLSLLNGLKELLVQLQFRKGWGVLERSNSPFEIYSFVGYVFAFIGGMVILSKEKLRKKYFIFLLWTLSVLFYLVFFKVSGFSFLSPYQRNVYYFAISLPILSAFGFVSILNTIALKIKYSNIVNKNMVFNVVKVISIGVLLLFLFIGYNALPGDTRLYKVIDDNSYDALKFLLSVPVEDGSKVMAPIFTSTAMFPVSGHEPVGTIFFYGIRKDAENFFKGNVSECGFREELINKHNVNYVLSPVKMDCDWEILYDVEGLGDRGNWTIYDVR